MKVDVVPFDYLYAMKGAAKKKLAKADKLAADKLAADKFPTPVPDPPPPQAQDAPQSEVSEVETFSFALGGEEISIAPAAAAAVSDYINPTVRYINECSPDTLQSRYGSGQLCRDDDQARIRRHAF